MLFAWANSVLAVFLPNHHMRAMLGCVMDHDYRALGTGVNCTAGRMSVRTFRAAASRANALACWLAPHLCVTTEQFERT